MTARPINLEAETLGLVKTARTADIQKPKIISAAGSILKLRAGDALRFVIAHEQRHVLQAQKILEGKKVS